MKDRIILFDLDGTLIDSTDAIYEGFCVAFEKNGLPIPSHQAVVGLIGHTLEDMCAKLGTPVAGIDRCVADYKAHYHKVSQQKTKLLPCAERAILEASKCARIGAVTTKTGRFSRELLEHFGLLGYFECVIGREDVKRAKPDSEPILKALSEMRAESFDKSQVYMIGDTPLDILAARNAGIEGIGVLSGYASEEVLRKYTDRIVPDALFAVRLIADS